MIILQTYSLKEPHEMVSINDWNHLKQMVSNRKLIDDCMTILRLFSLIKVAIALNLHPSDVKKLYSDSSFKNEINCRDVNGEQLISMLNGQTAYIKI